MSTRWQRKSPRNSTKTALLLSLALFALAIPAAIRSAHATGGTLYVSPSFVAPQSPNTTFTAQIKVGGLTNLTSWQVSIQTDPSIINPIGLSIAGNLFSANYSEIPTVLASCINGEPSGSCTPADGSGIVTLIAFILGTPPVNPPPNGLLFTITYNVTGTGSFASLHIFNDILSYGANQIPHSTQDGSYGAGPHFTVAANAASLILRAGLNETATLSLKSINQFAGLVSFAAQSTGPVNFTDSGGRVLFGNSSLLLKPAGSNSTTVTFSTMNSTSPVDYPITITGSSGSLHSSTAIDVQVKPHAYFVLNSSPSHLLIHQGTSGGSVITAQSAEGFSGNVNLTVTSPQGVGIGLNTTTLTVESGKQAEAALTISVPLSELAFKYLINVTANSGSLPPVVSQIIVQPPPGTFSVSVGSGSMTIEAGRSANATIIISSLDYLSGFVYISATMSGGAASLSTTRVFLPPSGTADSTVTVAIGADTVPGVYILLLTIYQIGSLTTIIPVTIFVTGVVHSRPLSSTNLILGLSPPVYFGILGVLAAILAILSVEAYRKSKED